MKTFTSNRPNLDFSVDGTVFWALGELSADGFLDFLVIVGKLTAGARVTSAKAKEEKARKSAYDEAKGWYDADHAEWLGLKADYEVNMAAWEALAVEESTTVARPELQREPVEPEEPEGQLLDVEPLRVQVAVLKEAIGVCCTTESADLLITRVSSEERENPIGFKALQEILGWLMGEYTGATAAGADSLVTAAEDAGIDPDADRPTLPTPVSPTGLSETGVGSEVASSSEAESTPSPG